MLWASVRDTKQREGVILKVQVFEGPNGTLSKGHPVQEACEVQRPSKTQRERLIVRLQKELAKIEPKREQLKQELEVLSWREKLLALAIERGERVKECGWDQRLCFDEEEYAEFSAGVLESYQEASAGVHNSEGDDGMEVDGSGVEEGEWWCRGKRKCERHQPGYVGRP